MAQLKILIAYVLGIVINSLIWDYKKEYKMRMLNSESIAHVGIS